MAKKNPRGGGRKELKEADKVRGRSLGARIQRARNKMGWRQEDLAFKAGVRLNTLKSLESGRVFSPSVFLIADLAKILGKELAEWVK